MNWISCNEKLPNDIEDVLFFAYGDEIILGYYNHKLNLWFENKCFDYGIEQKKVTHWTPLIKPTLFLQP